MSPLPMMCAGMPRNPSSGIDEMPCKFTATPAAADEHFVKHGMSQYMRLKVQFGWQSMLLDTLGPQHDVSDGDPRLAMVRRPLSARFDPCQIQQWLDACDRYHHHKILNKYRIASSLRELIHRGHMRLINVRRGVVEVVSEPVRYFALSYVWGESMARYAKKRTQAESSNLGSKDDEIDWKEVPRTIADAVALLRDTSENYLWVDYLCINQHDKGEMASVISSMSAIYESAYATIVAADHTDADGGLYRFGVHEDAAELAMHFDVQNAVLPRRRKLESVLQDTKWSTRAWTYQEQLLSRRCIYFTRSEVFFRCGEAQCCETFTMSECGSPARRQSEDTELIPRRKRARKAVAVEDRIRDKLPGSTFSHYSSAVEAFTKRDLTHEGDRLDAFMGVLDRLQPAKIDATSRVALSGLPVKGFLQALFWTYNSATGLDAMPKDWAKRIESDQRASRSLPSWSWAGWTGSVQFPVQSEHHDAVDAKVIDSFNVVLDKPRSALPYNKKISSDCVTVHLEVRCIPCFVAKSKVQDSTSPLQKYEICLPDSRLAEGAHDMEAGNEVSIRGECLGIFWARPEYMIDMLGRRLSDSLISMDHGDEWRFSMLLKRFKDSRIAHRIAVISHADVHLSPPGRARLKSLASDTYVQLQ